MLVSGRRGEETIPSSMPYFLQGRTGEGILGAGGVEGGVDVGVKVERVWREWEEWRRQEEAAFARKLREKVGR